MMRLICMITAVLSLMLLGAACKPVPQQATPAPAQRQVKAQAAQSTTPLVEQETQPAAQEAAQVEDAAPVAARGAVVEWAEMTTSELSRACGPGVGLGTYEDYKILDFHTDIAEATLALPELPTGSMARTMSAICRVLRTASNTTATIARQGGMKEKQLFALAIGPSGALKFWGYCADVDSSAMLEIGRWHHVAVTYDGKAATVYLEGKARHTQYLDLATLQGPLVLGGHGFRGSISEVQIWDRALSPEEMSAAAERAHRAAYKAAE